MNIDGLVENAAFFFEIEPFAGLPSDVLMIVEASPRVEWADVGAAYVLDRDTGEPLIEVEERPVPTDGVPGEVSSLTQPFPVRPPPLHQPYISPDDAWGLTFWDKGACRDKLEALVTGPIYTPPSSTGTVCRPI